MYCVVKFNLLFQMREYKEARLNGEKTMEEQILINKTEKPNSFETGKPGSRFKIYFSDVDDLHKQLKELVEAGLILEEDFKNVGK